MGPRRRAPHGWRPAQEGLVQPGLAARHLEQDLVVVQNFGAVDPAHRQAARSFAGAGVARQFRRVGLRRRRREGSRRGLQPGRLILDRSSRDLVIVVSNRSAPHDGRSLYRSGRADDSPPGAGEHEYASGRRDSDRRSGAADGRARALHSDGARRSAAARGDGRSAAGLRAARAAAARSAACRRAGGRTLPARAAARRRAALPPQDGLILILLGVAIGLAALGALFALLAWRRSAGRPTGPSKSRSANELQHRADDPRRDGADARGGRTSRRPSARRGARPDRRGRRAARRRPETRAARSRRGWTASQRNRADGGKGCASRVGRAVASFGRG